MAHEFFRYLIPGVVFYLPLYIAAGLVYLCTGDSTLLRKIKDYTTFLSLLVLPTGWFVYQAWRVLWQVYRGGYEPKSFLGRIRRSVRVYHQESQSRTVVDFSPILGKKVGVRWFTDEEFESTFDPFKKIRSSFWFQSRRGIVERAAGRRRFLHFVEHVSDLILFADHSYDYARSIASARYGMWVSAFAFVYGLTFPISLYPWYSLPGNSIARWTSAIAVLLVLGSFSVFAYSRARMARMEHEARVQLITHINSTDRLVRSTTTDLNSQILDNLKRLEALIRSQRKGSEPRLAAFDMDGTLIRDDMGDAVLAMLIFQGRVPRGAWEHYQELLLKSRPKAYEWAVKAMKGLTVSDVTLAARQVLDLRPTEKIVVSRNVLVPRPQIIAQMQSVVMWLHRHGYEVYIVSATNRWAAAVVGADFFGIAEDHIIGVETRVVRSRLTDEIIRPAPIAEGKLQAWQKRFQDRKPLVGAGDTEGDHYMLSFVDPSGFVIWWGSPEKAPVVKHVVKLNVGLPIEGRT